MLATAVTRNYHEERSIMNVIRTVIAIVTLALASSAFAYQVTGPVLEVTDSKIVVQKGKEKWEIARTADTKVTGDLKVGAKVTVEYTMTAKSVEAKADKAKKK
jgi:hypothetical protein